MSINKIYLPEVNVLEDYLSREGSASFNMRYVRKREAFIGSSESIEFINNFYIKYSRNESSEFTEIN